MLIQRLESDKASYRKFAGCESSPGRRERRIHDPIRLVLTPKIVTRFVCKVKQGTESECWPWQAARFPTGYGQFNAGRDAYGTQDTRYAHRIAFQLATGIDPVGKVVMHACDNPPCCNPAHLRLGTQADNLQDASRKGRLPKTRLGNRRLSDDDVAAIRASTLSGPALGRQFNVTSAHISLVRRGLRRAA